MKINAILNRLEIDDNNYKQLLNTVVDDLIVENDASFNGDVEISGRLIIHGDVSLNKSLDVSDQLTVYGDASFQTNVDICGTLTVGGNTRCQDFSATRIHVEKEPRYRIALGDDAGETEQGDRAIAIGTTAGNTNQEQNY